MDRRFGLIILKGEVKMSETNKIIVSKHQQLREMLEEEGIFGYDRMIREWIETIYGVKLENR